MSRYGFTWVATTNGLNRFDGYRFEAFTDDEDLPQERRLSGNNIEKLEETQDGKLIILYNNKPTLFDILDPLTNQVQRVAIQPENNLLGTPVAITVDEAGLVFVTTISANETIIYQYKEGTFLEYFTLADNWPSSFPYLRFLHLREEKGFLIFDHIHGVRHFSESGQLLRVFDMSDFNRSVTPQAGQQFLYFLKQSQNGRVYISFNNQKGLYWWKPEESRFQLCPLLSKEKYYSLWEEDERGNVMIGAGEPLGTFPKINDLYCLLPEEQLIDFSHLLDVGNFVVSLESRNFFRTIFFGIDTGLKIVQNSMTGISSFLKTNTREDERGVVIRGMCQDTADYIYIAKETDHWYRLDPSNDVLDTIILRDELTGERIDFNCSLELLYDPAGYVWGSSCPTVGERLGRIHRYDISTCMTRSYSFPFIITCMTFADDGKIWLGYTSNKNLQAGIALFDTKTGESKTIRDKDQRNFLAGSSKPRYLLVDQANKLWIGTDNGLFVYDPADKTHRSWDVKEDRKPHIFSDNAFYVIHEDTAQNIWLGTGNGLNIFNPVTEEVQKFDVTDGLASNTICGILQDDLDNYWISTYNGLSHYEVESKKFLRFYRTDGFNNDEFNRFSFHRDSFGRLYFGGVNGFNAFYPEDILQYRSTPTVVLTRFSYYNSRADTTVVQTDNLHQLNEIDLAPFDKYFSLDFALPVYTRTKRNKFKAFLEGYEAEWQHLDDQHSVRYDNLPAGEYTLHLLGADPNGNWSTEALSIPVKVREKFFNLLWVRLILLGLAFAFIYYLSQRRLQARLREEHLRMRLSSDLHDEVSGLLAGIAMQSDLLSMRVKDADLKSRMLTIGDVSRKAMSKMSDVIWSIDSRKDKVGDLLNRMQQHADDVLLPMDIRYSFQTEKLEKDKLMPANIRQDLYFFFKEVINNVVKHAQADRVRIRVANNGSHFELRVQDNGVGDKKDLAETKKKSGQGISNLYMRAQRLNADLNISRTGGYDISLKMKKFTK